MSLLAIDAGNTRIKWGLHDGHEWFLRGAFATADAGTPVAFSHLQPGQSIGHIIVSNVAGPEIANRIKDALYPRGAPIAFIVSQAQQCGVTSRYQAPKQLGCDRWAALVAAHATSRAAPRAQLVVMAGTALTVDALTAEGVFLGGLIVPGPELMRHSLSRGTALLPAGEGDYQTFPRTSLNAIASGAIEACSGAVQRMYTHLSAQTGTPPHCMGSGGAMAMLSHHLPFAVEINDNLVLDGLLEIFRSEHN